MQNRPTRCQRPGCGGRLAVVYGDWVCHACGHGPEAKIHPRRVREGEQPGTGNRRVGAWLAGERVRD